MNILVTGGAGFIGSWLCEELLAKGHVVICIDNFNDYYNPEFKKNNIKHLHKNKNFILYVIDIRDYDSLKKVYSKHKIDKIIHLGALGGVRYSILNPLLYRDVNISGTSNMLELAKEFKIDHFVFASSSSVYGNNKKIPFSESDNVDRPISPYAATKKAGELLCHNYHHLHGINVICLRFFTVYGPRGRPDMAPYLFTKAVMEGKPIEMYGDGKTKRDYTYVTDIISGILAAMDLKGYHIINLGNNKPVELAKFIKSIEKAVGKKAKIIKKPIPQGDVKITFANIQKAKKLLGYSPKISIDEGIRRTVKWYKGLKR